jgi:hypothetical protein
VTKKEKYYGIQVSAEVRVFNLLRIFHLIPAAKTGFGGERIGCSGFADKPASPDQLSQEDQDRLAHWGSSKARLVLNTFRVLNLESYDRWNALG